MQEVLSSVQAVNSGWTRELLEGLLFIRLAVRLTVTGYYWA